MIKSLSALLDGVGKIYRPVNAVCSRDKTASTTDVTGQSADENEDNGFVGKALLGSASMFCRVVVGQSIDNASSTLAETLTDKQGETEPDKDKMREMVDGHTKSSDIDASVPVTSSTSIDGCLQSASETLLPEVEARDVKYLCVKLGIPSKAIQERPAIGSLIKSLLPPVDWIEHYFCVPNDCVVELDNVLTRLFPQEEADEKMDVVSSEISQSNSKRSKPVYRRALSFAELHNLPLPELSEPSSILDESHIRLLREHLPPRADGRPWQLVYSTERDGFSLSTLYRRMADINCPVLLVIVDNETHIFGAMLPCKLRVSESFYGNGELFLFTFHPFFKKYNWSGKNNFFIKGNLDSLAIGAGCGLFGLWLDDNFYHGRTRRCETFDNEPLVDVEDFTVKCVETWAFP